MRALRTSFDDPQIEVLANSPRREMLMSRLATLGFRPIRAGASLLATGATPLLVDLASRPNLDRRALASSSWLRPLVLLGEPSEELTLPDDTVRLKTLETLDQLHSRLTLRARRRLAVLEGELRTATAASFDEPSTSDPKEPAAAKRRGVLYFGSFGQSLLALSRGLSKTGTPLTAALTWNNALDYLVSGDISLLLVDAEQLSTHRGEIERALELFSDVTIVGIGQACDAPFIETVIDLTGDPASAVDLISGLAARTPLPTRLRKVRLSSRTHDPQTGLYSETFLRAHLARQMPELSLREIPQSLLHLRLRRENFDRSRLAKALDRLAEMTIASLRETDLVCRFETCSLLVNLPGATHGEAARIAQRLKQVSEREAAIGTALMWRASERRVSYSPDQFIFAALNGPFSRLVAA